MVLSIKEARKILGNKSSDMNDEEIRYLIKTLQLMAKDALNISVEEVHRKRDAYRLAQLTYDIYQDKKRSENGSNDK